MDKWIEKHYPLESAISQVVRTAVSSINLAKQLKKLARSAFEAFLFLYVLSAVASRLDSLPESLTAAEMVTSLKSKPWLMLLLLLVLLIVVVGLVLLSWLKLRVTKVLKVLAKRARMMRRGTSMWRPGCVNG